MKRLFIAAIVLITVFAIASCASSGGGGAQAPIEIPEGAELLSLENGAYAIFRFDLPPNTTWANYNRLTAEYMLDEVNLKKPQRNSNNVRLMGNYAEDRFRTADGNMWANLADDAGNNGPYIIDNTPRTFAGMGAEPGQWFTITYNITGSAAHSQFNRANIPAASATGPFFFGLGIPSHDPGRRGGMSQFVRNVTLHHATNPALNVVSTGSGFEQPAFASFYPILSRRVKPE